MTTRSNDSRHVAATAMEAPAAARHTSSDGCERIVAPIPIGIDSDSGNRDWEFPIFEGSTPSGAGLTRPSARRRSRALPQFGPIDPMQMPGQAPP